VRSNSKFESINDTAGAIFTDVRSVFLRCAETAHRFPHYASMHAQFPRHTDHRPNSKLALPTNLLA
jgi:hypothetical protein